MLLLLIASVLCLGGSEAGFYLVNKRGKKADEGLLIADRVGSHKVGSVCDDQFNDTAAEVICRDMNYDDALLINNDKKWKSEKKWAIQDDYGIVLDDVTCADFPGVRFSDCSYVRTHDCSTSEQVFLKCGCNATRYLLPQHEGCSACPAGAVESLQDRSACTCAGGNYWVNDSCSLCPENTYKPAQDDSPCSSCPEKSNSDPGSTACRCAAGFYWNVDTCVRCSDGSVSGAGSSECSRCPPGTAPLPGNTACSCPAGEHWKNTNCSACPSNYYSTPNSTSCTKCPVPTVSDPGAAHCSPCPAGYYWHRYLCYTCTSSEDHASCDRCPAGYVYSVSGMLCVEDTASAITKGTVNWTVVGLTIIVIVFLIVILLLIVRLIRNRRPAKVPNPVTYQAVQEGQETWHDNTENPGYAEPNGYSEPNGAIYAEPNSTHYIQSDSVGYVEPDRGIEQYVESDRLQHCGLEEENEEAYRVSTENIYDNI